MKRSMVMIFILIIFASSALILLFHKRNQPESVIDQQYIDSCRSFAIYSSSQNIKVSKNAGKWYVYYKGRWYPGDEDKIAAFINAMGTLRTYAKAGNTEDVWPSLGVDTVNAVSFKCRGSRSEKEIYFGKNIENTPYIFMREGNRKQTYEADSPPRALFQNVFYWMRLQIYADIVPSRINSLTFYRPTAAFGVVRTMVNGKDEWILNKSGRKSVLGRLPVGNLLEQIVNLKAEGVSDISSEGLKVLGRLEISSCQGKNHILSFYQGSGNRIYVKSRRSVPLYLLSTAAYRSVFPTYVQMLNTY